MKILERLGSWEKNQNADNRTVDTKAHMPAGRVEDIEQLGLVEELVRDYAADNRTVGMKEHISADNRWDIELLERLG